MINVASDFVVKLAQTSDEVRAAQGLRYDVFVREMGGSGDLVDHQSGLEIDRFDPYFKHLIAIHKETGKVAGVYRILDGDRAAKAGQFYSEDEFDLTVLKSSGRKLLELGRSCLHPDFRGGSAMYHLWNGLAQYVRSNEIEILFGVASFPGTNPEAHAESMSLLHHSHLAPQNLRVKARSKNGQRMKFLPADQIDRRRAMLKTPTLIKAYLRLGGFVGEGAFIDHAFNTTDICLVLDVDTMSTRQRRIYSGESSE